ncbi:MAG TPA: DUF4339 domain-containing protein [Tepidisphaeraceae bacterium]|nr:DUF4339 domain-containing protein [Tepidisphaeraceae bacterium]
MATEWFYWANDQQHGPVAEDALKAMAAAGTLRPEDLVRSGRSGQWRPAGHATDWNFGPALVMPISAEPAQAGTISYAAPAAENLVLSPRALDVLLRTGPWVRFLAVFGYVITGVWAVAGIFMVLRALIATSNRDEAGGSAVVCFGFAVVSAFAAGYAGRYAAGIRRLAAARRSIELEEALDAQRAFWKFCGILAICVLAGYVLLGGIFILLK